MPDVDDLKPDLLYVRDLFLPPLITHVIHQFAALDPRRPVPFKTLINPVFMHPAVHAVLHMQHIENGISIHRLKSTA